LLVKVVSIQIWVSDLLSNDTDDTKSGRHD
jgi:hypothetical protein